MLVETFLAKMQFSDSLTDGTFSIIREPIDDFYVGFPFNFRELKISDIKGHFKELGYTLSSKALDALSEMDTYGISVFKVEGRTIVPCVVNYLYSIPSWGGGNNNGASNS